MITLLFKIAVQLSYFSYATGDAVPAEYEMSWLYDGLANYYAYWVPEEDLDDFKYYLFT